MKFALTYNNIDQIACDCLVLGLFQKQKLTGSLHSIDKATGGYLNKLIHHGDITGKSEEAVFLPLHHQTGVKSARLLIIGLGDENNFNDRNYIKALNCVWAKLKNSPAKNIVFALTEAPVGKKTMAWKIQQAVLSVQTAFYKYLQPGKKDKNAPILNSVSFLIDKNQLKSCQTALNNATAIAQGMNLARQLGDTPANMMTPTHLAKQAQQLQNQYSKVKTEILSEAQMKKLGMGSLLSVAQGSEQPAKLIVIHYKGKDSSQKPVVLVGKGVTFDSGGISLKPGPNMDEMKYDMLGAATVLGCINAAAEAKLPVHLIGVIPTTENLPSGHATKPGDVFTSMSGKTIEVLNTDAEGRLILCDALTYCERFKPDVVIDIATLTGAMIIALGKYKSGLFCDDEKLTKSLLSAGLEINDECWHMPMGEEYTEELKSNFADLANIGSRYGGSIVAACFLAQFTQKFKWAHLDIAGVAWNSGLSKAASGRPIPLLMQYLIDRFQ